MKLKLTPGEINTAISSLMDVCDRFALAPEKRKEYDKIIAELERH